MTKTSCPGKSLSLFPLPRCSRQIAPVLYAMYVPLVLLSSTNRDPSLFIVNTQCVADILAWSSLREWRKPARGPLMGLDYDDC